METLGSNCSPKRHSGAQVRELYANWCSEDSKNGLSSIDLPIVVQ